MTWVGHHSHWTGRSWNMTRPMGLFMSWSRGPHVQRDTKILQSSNHPTSSTQAARMQIQGQEVVHALGWTLLNRRFASFSDGFFGAGECCIFFGDSEVVVRNDYAYFSVSVNTICGGFGFSFSVFLFFSFSIFQFFSFSIFQFCGRIGQEQLDNCILRVSSLHVMYFPYMI